MMRPDDVAAGEYVLGTLDHQERLAFERALSRDAGLRASVEAWERRLAPLGRDTVSHEPPADLFNRIEQRLTQQEYGQIHRLQRLDRSRGFWRSLAVGASALAAALALYVAVPHVMPAGDAGFISVVDRGGALPPLIVRVDVGRREIAIQPIAADTPAGRSLELWFVRDGQSPRSLGVMDASFTSRSLPEDIDRNALSNALFAVSVEPPGGSPSGAPTGPVIYTGKLIPITASFRR